MIKNVVFDLGRVLVDFDPAGYIRSFGFSQEANDRLLAIVFGHDWYLHDRGDYLTIGDLTAALVKKYPDLAHEIKTVLTGDWVKIHYLKPESAAYLKELKARGYRIYILSNLSLESYGFISKYEFLQYTDGAVYSYRENACKPEEKIYRALLDRYALIPDETVFLDDVPENIAGAEAVGIHGVLFTGIEEAKKQTEALLSAE